MPAFVWVESRAAEPIIPLALFRNHTFSVTSGVGFIVGFALFGAITYLPLYFQITKGSSPTKSGLQLTPLMAGVLVTSIASGQLISRLGRYRMFPIAGTALMALAMLMLSRLEPGTSVWVASLDSLVLGLGLGMVMQVLVLAAQNAVDFRQIGVATSGSTLFRQIGGSIGVALFGSIFANRLHVELAARLPAKRSSRRPSTRRRSGTCRPRRTGVRGRVRGGAAPGVHRRGGCFAARVRAGVAPSRGPAAHGRAARRRDSSAGDEHAASEAA